MTSLSCVLVTRQQVLVSTVNTSSVDDHKENKVILNGRLRFFGAFSSNFKLSGTALEKVEFVSF